MEVRNPDDEKRATDEYERQVAQARFKPPKRQLDRLSDLDFALLLDSAREDLKQLNAQWVTYAGIERTYLFLRDQRPTPSRMLQVNKGLHDVREKLHKVESRLVAQRAFVRQLENELSSRTWNRG